VGRAGHVADGDLTSLEADVDSFVLPDRTKPSGSCSVTPAANSNQWQVLASAESTAVVDHGCTHHSRTAHTQVVDEAAEDNPCDAAMLWLLAV
jgi:hypothetical protein